MKSKRILLSLSCLCLLGITYFLGCNNGSLARQEPEEKKDALSSENAFHAITLTPLAPNYEFGKYGFSGIALLNNGEIWSVGYDGENPGRVRHSTDSGKTWEVRFLSSEFNKLTGIIFIDNLHGWASGRNEVYLTTNGGSDWKKSTIKTYAADLNYVSFYNEKVGYVAGNAGTRGEEGVEIWRTEDGGESWEKSYATKQFTNMHTLLAVSNEIALAILNGENIIRTDDRGKTWKVVTSFHYPNRFSLSQDGKIWLAGRNGIFFYSIDEGRTWNLPNNLPEDILDQSWNHIAFIDSQLGFAIGNKGAMAITKNGGTTWRRIESGVKEDLDKMYINQDIKMILGSKNLYQMNIKDK